MNDIYNRSWSSGLPRREKVNKKTNHHFRLWSLVVLLLFGIAVFGSTIGHASTPYPAIKSGIDGYCIDNHGNSESSNNPINSEYCNNSDAQNFTLTGTTINHDSTYCLGVANNSVTPYAKIVLNTCSGASGQVWLRDRGGFQNPNSGLCLAIPESLTGVELVASPCSDLSQFNEQWTPVSAKGTPISGNNCGAETLEGARVGCFATQEWTAWQAKPSSHYSLLNNYTDGNSYEQWCADFVSYVYKEAGYPFSQGERGWDEYNANNIQNMANFTLHYASSNYVPRTGDVAFFDYAGGHVEIVVSGGKNPTFVYGDSATPDPVTGNGDMMANTITNDGINGQVIYYLTPGK